MEDNQNGRRPKWKTTKSENSQKMTKSEGDQNERQPKQKTTKMEDDQNVDFIIAQCYSLIWSTSIFQQM